MLSPVLLFLAQATFHPVHTPPPAEAGVVIDLGGETRAATPAPAPVALPQGPRVDLEFQDADVRDVLRLMAALGDINIVVDDTVQGAVTVRLSDVYWSEALGAILATQGLQAQSFGTEILVVSPL